MRFFPNNHLTQVTCVAFLVLSISAGSKTLAQTNEPSREPILRIETGMHTAIIRRIGIDRAGKFLVTSSEDKTARVWELATGRLLRVLRVPIGEKEEGRLFAAAISPDGTTIAVGGRTGYLWENEFSVDLFDRESGKLIHRLTGLPHKINDLTFSPDGARLAATLKDTNGVRVWRTLDWAEAGSDPAYGGDSYGADFDRAGRLITSCWDGRLRLYDREMRLLKNQRAPGGKHPFTVRFSPDGRKVVVGYDDSKQVDVLSSENLSLLYSADTSGLNDSPLSSVSWSTDGKILYAGGSYVDNSGSAAIRSWSDAGLGRYVDTPIARNLITDIRPLPTGGIVYSTGVPTWGILDDQHKQTVLQIAQTANYGDMLDGFLTNSTASAIRFVYGDVDSLPALFQIYQRALTLGVAVPNDMHPPATEASATKLIKTSSHLDKIKIEKDEEVRSAAISSDGERFLLGTEWYIRLYSRDGRELWSVDPPGAAWSVNISGDGRLALAAYADGTIRWYRMTDGRELLAFFPHRDHKRWVLWSPSGYYDASPGAEDLIGWQVNNGKDQAAVFFPVGQFRSTYYRPDVISKVLETEDEARAMQFANEERGRKTQISTITQMLPPVVEIASPADNSEASSAEITIRYLVRSPSDEPVTSVRALVDGRPVSADRQLIRDDKFAPGASELNVPIPARDSEVSIIAQNRFGASVPATIRLRWHGSTPSTEAFVSRPNLYVLAIGVSEYQNASYSLKFSAKDAHDFVNAVMTQKGLLYRDVKVKELTNANATKDEIEDGLDWIRKETTSKDVAMIFFAGHGLNDQNGVYYFLPYNTDLEKLLRTGVPFTDIKNTVQSLAGKTLFFIDTCHSGNVLGGRRGLADDINGIINELSSAESGAVVFAASTGNQYSLEDAKWNNGAFTKALVEGLTGRADYTGKGRITINMLDLYLSERVKELTGGRQTPTTAKPNTIQDFPIAVKR